MSGLARLPPLKVLDRPPSWVNRAGRVDRSACIEVRASELWRSCTNMKSARTSKGRLAAGTVTMHTRWLVKLHEKRLPFDLQGDFRTAKSNAMKHPLMFEGKPVREQSWPFNPNRSASRTKMLGLWLGGEPGYEEAGPWKQQLRIERWQRGKRAATYRRGAPPSHQHFMICPCCETKVSKLFMVLCTEEEIFDAELAEGWIARCDARYESSHDVLPCEFLEMRAKLIDRYGPLFRARRLLCRSCLRVRYGQVRDTDRRIDPYYREKVHRDDTDSYHTNLPR